MTSDTHQSASSGSFASAFVYTVYVDENFHYRDEDARYTQGCYATYEEALVVVKGILEQDLQSSMEKGKSGKEWLEGYFMFGEDPWISPTPDGTLRFSAWDYAQEIAKQEDGAVQ